MDLTHAFKVALEQTVKETISSKFFTIKTSKKQNASVGKKGSTMTG